MSQRQVHRVRTVDWKRESRAAGPRRAAFDGRRFWLGVFLGLAGALLATAALAGVPLTANGTDDNAHATAVDGTSGRLHAVYERGGVIYARNRPLGSPWTAEAVVATGTAPAIGLNPTNGRPYVAFVFAGNPYVTSWDGTAWATPAQLDSTASTSEVSLGVANDGTVFAGWNYSNGLASVRFASWYAGVTTVLHSLAGWTIGNPVNCGDLYHEPRVRMGSGTQYYLVYRHSRPGNGCGATGSIEVRSNGAGWTGVANSASVNQADITLGRRPAAVDGGTLHLTWYAGGVRHATVTSAGFAGEAVVSATGSAPAVAVTDGPTIHVAMVDAAGRVEVRTDAGGGFGAPTTIATATSGRQPGFATFTSGGVLRYAYVTS